MIIAIDLTSLSYHMSGIERYAASITEKMLGEDHKNEYILIFRNNIYPTFEHFVDNLRIKAVILRGNKKLLFLQIVLPFNLQKIKADKYVFFAFSSPILFRKKGIINTIHDVGFWDCPEVMNYLHRLYCRISCRTSVSASEKLITVSEFSKKRLNDILKFPLSKILVAYSAVSNNLTESSNFSFGDVQEKYNLPDKYIMTLSTLEPRKNMELLLKAFSDIQDKVDYDLVLVGRKGWKVDDLIERYNYKDRIHMTGFVEDKHVSVIYRNALCFVFPTLYEGFGLPPVEALALGTPVISSDAASMPEILRDQAVYFRNKNQQELENLLLNLEYNVDSMPHDLDEYQKKNYKFDVSAKKILTMLEKG